MSSQVVIKDGKSCLVVEGAKGGRERFPPIDTKMKEDAVKLAQETARILGNGTGRIIPPEMNLKQAYNTQQNEWANLVGKRESNANMHGERHWYARDKKPTVLQRRRC